MSLAVVLLTLSLGVALTGAWRLLAGRPRSIEAAARRAGLRLPPIWRIVQRQARGPLPPTRHTRLVQIADTAS